MSSWGEGYEFESCFWVFFYICFVFLSKGVWEKLINVRCIRVKTQEKKLSGLYGNKLGQRAQMEHKGISYMHGVRHKLASVSWGIARRPTFFSFLLFVLLPFIKAFIPLLIRTIETFFNHQNITYIMIHNSWKDYLKSPLPSSPISKNINEEETPKFI